MYYFIVNPASRSGQGRILWKQIHEILLEHQIPYQVLFTHSVGHGTTLTKKLASKLPGNHLIVIGGDGTVNEVLNGLPSDPSILFSYLPVGSGNDFARGLNLSDPPLTLFQKILKNDTSITLDLGTLKTGKHHSSFGISAGIGYDAEICFRVSRTPVKKFLNRLHLGKFVYAFEAIRLIFSFQPTDMDIELDQTRRYHFPNVYFLTAMNLPYEGGGFHFCPKASPLDGKLDFIIVHSLPKLAILLLFPTAYFGLHTHFSGITILRGEKLRVHAQKKLYLHRDGEESGISDTVTFEAKKGTLTFR